MYIYIYIYLFMYMYVYIYGYTHTRIGAASGYESSKARHDESLWYHS